MGVKRGEERQEGEGRAGHLTPGMASGPATNLLTTSLPGAYRD
jgi:hypothetical protein